jgi:hypothetical protein
MFQCLSFNYIPLDVQNKIKKYYENISFIRYALEYEAYIIRICEFIDYSTNLSYSDKIDKIKSYDFSEYYELNSYLYESYYESYSNKQLVENFYKKIYNKHLMLHNLVIAYERENKLIYPKICNYI